jgi:hypothetical protein
MRPGTIGVLGARYAPQPPTEDIAPMSENGSATLANSAWVVTQNWAAVGDGVLGVLNIDAVKAASALTVQGTVALGDDAISQSGGLYQSGSLQVKVLSSFGSASIGSWPGYTSTGGNAVNFSQGSGGSVAAGSHFALAVWVGPSTVTPPATFSFLPNEMGWTAQLASGETIASLFNPTSSTTTVSVPWTPATAHVWTGTSGAENDVAGAGGTASISLAPSQTAILDSN